MTTAEMSNLEKRVLVALAAIGEHATPEQIREKGGFREIVEVMNGSSWLQAKGFVRHEETLRVYDSLGREGKAAVERKLPERRALEALAQSDGRGALSALVAQGALDADEAALAVGWLRRKGWATVAKEGAETVLSLTPQGEEHVGRPGADEKVLEILLRGEISESELAADGVKALTARQNMIRRREEITRIIHLTEKGTRAVAKGIEIREQVTQLTPELIASGRWKELELAPYDVKAFTPRALAGKKHPLRQIIDQIRTIFLDMGFTEIEGPYVRSAFWNMDVLFTPQDHPAREMQDTFYLSEPARAQLSGPIVERVTATHETGGDTGSTGWRNPWSRDVAAQNLLRTHTTVDTVQFLHEHPDPPVKIFSVDRVFRNEALDATHLDEFHQIEGVVMEEGANLRQLIGLLRQFYASLGFDQVRVRPAYFPYTEPSLEVEVFYNNRWMELGGAGIFRPEVTEAIGVKHPVLAWGMGLERLAMMMLRLKDLRELYVSDIDWLRNQPLL
ncbi:MAG: phenylalanine--tRNA ligase subunit alpha [Thermoplasmatota archaeon]